MFLKSLQMGASPHCKNHIGCSKDRVTVVLLLMLLQTAYSLYPGKGRAPAAPPGSEVIVYLLLTLGLGECFGPQRKSAPCRTLLSLRLGDPETVVRGRKTPRSVPHVPSGHRSVSLRLEAGILYVQSGRELPRFPRKTRAIYGKPSLRTGPKRTHECRKTVQPVFRGKTTFVSPALWLNNHANGGKPSSSSASSKH